MHVCVIVHVCVLVCVYVLICERVCVCERECVCACERERGGGKGGRDGERQKKSTVFAFAGKRGISLPAEKKKKSDREARVDAAKLDALERLPYRACTL